MSLEELTEKLKIWKSNMESKGLRINMGKTKIMCCGLGMNNLKDSGKYLCVVCSKGVGSNSIFCEGYQHWIHRRCCNIRGRLKEDAEFMCDRCTVGALPNKSKTAPSNMSKWKDNDLKWWTRFAILAILYVQVVDVQQAPLPTAAPPPPSLIIQTIK